VVVVAAIAGFAGSARCGVNDPLPIFSDGSSSVEVLMVPGVVKRARLETDFLCTSFDPNPVHIGVQIFNAAGVLQNDISAGVGSVLNVGFGETVTIGTSGTKALLESITIPVTGMQGAARVVATSNRVRCNVIMLDDAVSPPVALAALGTGVRPTAGPKPAGLPLPTFAGGQLATHSVVITGVVKRGRMETTVFCTSLASQNVDIGIQIMSPGGVVLNEISTGNGAVVGVVPGQTITVSTTGTKAFFEDQVITLGGVAQGAARVVTNSPDVACSAFVLDAAVSPPTSISSLTN